MFVGITVAWGDPFTYVQEHGSQQQLQQQFAADFGAGAALATGGSLDASLTRASAARFRKATAAGRVAAHLRISRIGLRKYIVRGTGHDDLMKGPGIYDQTGFPGSGMPVAIAGHRTTYGAPFLNIDQLRPGDPIVLDMPYGRFTYRMTHSQIITPSDWSIIKVGRGERTAAVQRAVLAQWSRTGTCSRGTCEHLVMTACHPKYSARQRIAVFARLERVQLRRTRR